MSAPASPRLPQLLAWPTYPIGPPMLGKRVATVRAVGPLRLVARPRNTARRTNRHLQLLLDVFLSPVCLVHGYLPHQALIRIRMASGTATQAAT